MRILNSLAPPAVLIAISLIGCSPDTIAANREGSPGSLPVAASANVNRPWSGSCNVFPVFTSQTTVTYTGTCQLAHLGRVSVSADQTIGAPDPTTGVITYTNVVVYTAANGDQLRVLGVGTGAPSAIGLTLLGAETADGGTGRFADASGSATIAGEVRFAGPPPVVGFYAVEGTLNY